MKSTYSEVLVICFRGDWRVWSNRWYWVDW